MRSGEIAEHPAASRFLHARLAALGRNDGSLAIGHAVTTTPEPGRDIRVAKLFHASSVFPSARIDHGTRPSAALAPGAATPPASPSAIPSHDADLLPLPDGATPIAITNDGGSFPTIFAEDIVIWGPNAAHASAYFVNPDTGEVSPSMVLRFTFIKVGGQWLINSYQEGLAG